MISIAYRMEEGTDAVFMVEAAPTTFSYCNGLCPCKAMVQVFFIKKKQEMAAHISNYESQLLATVVPEAQSRPT